MISIGIPCYNEARNIEALVADLMAQSVPDDLEFIIVDDSSTDATPVLLERIRSRDPRVSIVQHTVRRGSTAAWNSVFAKARGDFLIRLDGDIRIADTHFIERLVEPLRRRPVQPCLSYCAVVPRANPTTWVERGSGFIYRYIARQNAMHRFTAESLFCAVLGSTRRFYETYRIPENIIANDYYTARFALDRGYPIDIVDTAATVKSAKSLEDFQKQARRFKTAHQQVETALGSAPRKHFASAPAIALEALKHPLGAFSFLRLRREFLFDETQSFAWDVAETTK